MRSVRSILVVEGDVALRKSLCELLASDGWFKAAEAATHDVILLDIRLPDGDGCDLCARLRRRSVAAPVIILGEADCESGVVRGLAAGANDYITKPFWPAELLARLRAQLRTFDASLDAPLAVGPYGTGEPRY